VAAFAMRPAGPLGQQREQRIAELEARLASVSAIGVKAPVALLAMLATLVLFWIKRSDIAYYFSPRSALALGSEGGYHLDQLRSNRYAQIHGVPTVRGAYWRERQKTYVLIGIQGTPVLVRRSALPGEEWSPGSTPPQPNQSPFAVRGRLLAQEDADTYRDGFAKLGAMGEMRPHLGRLWILLEGEKPGSELSTLLFVTGLGIFFLLNAWFLWRAIEERVRSTWPR